MGVLIAEAQLEEEPGCEGDNRNGGGGGEAMTVTVVVEKQY